jgi:SAM-dependent methyltransferase
LDGKFLNAFEEIFSQLNGGFVLDVATGEGGYIPILQRYLNQVNCIIGVDSNRVVLRKASQNLSSPAIRFTQMNAEFLGFGTETFDTVNISASLHHLENVRRVLGEIKRVLKPGGRFILTEMHRDGTSEAQFNAIRIHHWAAAVDSSLGILHDRTFSRQEILSFVEEMNLGNLVIRDFPNTASDPMEEKAIKGVREYLDRYHQRLESTPGTRILKQQEIDLRESLATNGLQREPVLLIVAEKY